CPSSTRSIRKRNSQIDARGCHRTVLDGDMADGVGFEPTVGVNPRRFSRPVPSTARPPVRLARTRILGSACFHNKREWHGSLAQAGEGDANPHAIGEDGGPTTWPSRSTGDCGQV